MSHKVHELTQDSGSGFEFVGRFQFALYIHADDDIRTHLSGDVHRIVVYHTSVDKHHAIETHGSEHTGDGHTGTHGGREDSLVEHIFLALHDVLGHASIGDRQAIEVDGIVITQGEFAKEVRDVLSLDEATCYFLNALLVERYGDEVFFVHFAFAHVLVGSQDTVAQEEGPVLLAHHAIQLLGCVADGIESADDGAHAGSHHVIDRNAHFFDNLDGTDVSHALGTASAQYEAYLFPLLFRMGRSALYATYI